MKIKTVKTFFSSWMIIIGSAAGIVFAQGGETPYVQNEVVVRLKSPGDLNAVVQQYG
jgi:hypothetical protein